MIGLQLVPVVLSLIVLGAHFYRAGNYFGVAVALGLLALLAVRRRWVARAIQVVLVLGAAEWIRTVVRLAAWRTEHGQPALRMTLILVAVALVTALSALIFETARMRRRYSCEPAP